MSPEARAVSPALQVRAGLPPLLPALKQRAWRLCRDEQLADDLVQEAALRALRFEESYRPDTNLKAWLHQILFSVFITRCRKRRRDGKLATEHGQDPTGWWSEPRGANLECLSPPVERALESLPPHFGAVVALVDLAELTYGEAADRLGVPIGTVMSRLHRGRRLLAQELAEPERRAA